MMLTRKMRLKQAFQLCKSQRSKVCPNQGFTEQLLELETRVHGANSTTLDELVDKGWAQRKRAVPLEQS